MDMCVEPWRAQASSHARRGQIFLLVHHTLLIPSILAPPVVSLFEASSLKMKYTVLGASAATALSLAFKLELRAYVHTKEAKDYLLLPFDAQHNSGDLRNRIAQLLRETPLLPSCICAKESPIEPPPNDPAGQGAARDSDV